MPIFPRLNSLLRNLFRKAKAEHELNEELGSYLEMLIEMKIERGVNPDEARRQALIEIGGMEQVKEQVRETRLGHHLETLWQDLRYGVRMLLKFPTFTLVVAITLSLGIGANTAIFTLINVIMLKSLPVSHPEELVGLFQNAGGTSKNPMSFSQPLWEQIRDRQDFFNGVFVYGSTSADLSSGGETRPAAVGLVSGGFFSTLGVRPVIGRTLSDTDDYRGCPTVAVITHAFWQSEYGGGSDVVGKKLMINGQPFQIVGVTEPPFFGVEYGYYAPIWAPRCAVAILRPGANSMGGLVIGRLKPGVTLEQVRARLAALTPSILEATIPTNASAMTTAQYRKSTFGATSFSKGSPGLSRNYGEALFLLMAIVGVVLLIACANVANLLLARATARQHEIAVRLVLGASRTRLVRQMLTESVLLSLLGAVLSVVFASWGGRFLVGLLARRNQVTPLDLAPDVNVLGFTLAVGVLTGVIFGLTPALRAVRVDPFAAIKPGGRTNKHSRFRAGKTLVVGQIALSLVLIVGAGLLIGSWRRLATLDPGFQSEGVLLVGVNTRPARIPGQQLGATYGRILERLRALPGVAHASAAGLTPFGNVNSSILVDVTGYTPKSDNDVRVRFNQVSEGYFATLRTRLIAGRDFNSGDVPTSAPVAIVSEEFARKYFGGLSALGLSFRQRSGNEFSAPVEIVGIAANIKENSDPGASLPTVYYSLSQITEPWSDISFALRAEGSTAALVPGVKSALAESSARFSLDFRTLKQQLDESVRLSRMLGLLSGFFGSLALLLAAIGLYGVIAYSVARRRNEIGIRLALGATQTLIIRMILREVGRLVIIGVSIGLALAHAVTRLASAFLYGVSPNDPATLTLSALMLIAVSLGAALTPAWRAVRLDPMIALRDE